MAAEKVDQSIVSEIERIGTQLHMGLKAMNELAKQHERGMTSETFSVCVEQMTARMLGDVRELFNVGYSKG